MNFPLLLLGFILVLAACFSLAAVLEWLNEFQHSKYPKSPRSRSRPQKSSQARTKPLQETLLKVTFSFLFVSTLVLVFILYQQIFPPSLNEALEETKSENMRYRRILGLEKNNGRTSLIELTDTELKKKGSLLYKKIRDMNSFYDKTLRDLQNKLNRKEINESKHLELMHEQIAKASEEFTRESRTDAVMVLWELRNRIPPERRNHIIGLPNLNSADPRDGSVSLYSIVAGEFSFFFSEALANEIEELTKLLPDSKVSK